MKATQRTLLELSKAVERTVFDSTFSTKKGFLQLIDPRIKVAGAFIVLLSISLAKSIELLSFFFLLPFILAVSSNIPATFFIKRLSIVFLFTSLVAFFAIFGFVTPGETVFKVFGLGITAEGLKAALMLTLRASASAGIALLLPMTSKWIDLVGALRVFAVPWSVIFVLLLSYRYIFSVLKITQESYYARLSRQITPTLGEEYASLGNRIALLINRSVKLGENIQLAFVSRGCDKDSIQFFAKKLKINIYSTIWIVMSLICFLGAITWKVCLF